MLQRFMSRFSVETFSSHSNEKLRMCTLHCVINFGYGKNLRLRGLGHDFPSKIFFLTVPKNFVGEPFCAVFQKKSGSEKVYGEAGGSIKISVENFLSHSAEKIRRGNFLCCVSENFWWRKSLWIKGRGKYQGFIRKFYVSQCRNFLYGTPSVMCFRNYPARKKFLDRKGGDYQKFRSKFFCLRVPKSFVGEPFCPVFQKVSGSEKFYG